MCGIAGWIAPARPDLDDSTLAAMLRAIAHRGPDDEDRVRRPAGDGVSEVFLGHRRLAIIDLAGGRQPMCDDRAGLALVFNGEIYNFRELREKLVRLGHAFRLDSDTEVLLRAYQQWGEKVVDHLRGAFAFVVWDGPRQQLFMARDRFGEKPLYLYEADGGLFFASEVKALLRLPNCRATTDLDAVWDCLAYRYVPAPRTLFSGIRKLLPGTAATWRQGRLTERRYWTSPDSGQAAGATPGPAVVDEFLGRLDGAVSSQMVSDVPFGAFLSGGLDSSMIVALMSRHCERVNTFSVGFAEGGYSELGYAAQVARRFGTTHHELTIASRDVIDELPRLIAFRDAPVSEPSDVAIYRLACRAAQEVKMVLTGEGSDELLGGYPKHVFERFAAPWQLLPGGLRHGLVGPLVRALPYRFRRAKTALANLNIENEPERYARWFGALDHRERAALSVLQPGAPAPVDRPPFDADPANTALRRILYFDQTSWLPDNLLERGDRMSMAASIEARVPFLDHRLAEWVSALPDRYRVRGLSTKWILREAAKKVLPAEICRRPKVGFRVPVNVWFRGELRDYLLDHLQGPQSLTRAYYEPKVLDGLLAEHLDGRQNHEKLLWSLLNLEIWHRQYARD